MRTHPSQIVPEFNRIAAEYDARFGDECRRMHDVVLAWAAEDGCVPSTVLDVGCGTALLLSAAARRWPAARLLGVDPAERMLDVARSAVPGADLRLAAAERLPFAAGSVDVVFSTTSFGQWTDQVAGLREVGRVLAPGGRAYVAELNRPSLLRRLLFRLPQFRDPDEMRALVADAGLRVRRIEVLLGNVVVTAIEGM
jgi:ubiquinone/menaquinone biosynthesis C-methylase UbiE